MTHTQWARRLDVGAKVSGAMRAATMDKFEKVAWESEFVVVLLANTDWTEFVLVELVDAGPPPEVLAGFIARKLHFAGVAGIRGSRPAVALVVEPEDSSISLMSAAVVRHMLSGNAKQKA